jgi:hypothetical protein
LLLPSTISLPLSTPVINTDTFSLPIIPEDNDLMSLSSSEPFSNTIDPSPASYPNLSPKQIQDILQKITSHLELHGQITPKLLKLLDQDFPSTKNKTSTTPINRPTLLSSDKMSNTAPTSMRFTVQQLSRHLIRRMSTKFFVHISFG